jgi:hypothetical protein
MYRLCSGRINAVCAGAIPELSDGPGMLQQSLHDNRLHRKVDLRLQPPHTHTHTKRVTATDVAATPNLNVTSSRVDVDAAFHARNRYEYRANAYARQYVLD